MALQIPARLTAAIKFLRGDQDGERWLAALPRRISYYERSWGITPLSIAEGGAMSCCVYCETAAGKSAVLKIPVDSVSGRREARALARWAPSGAAPTVYQVARSSGVFLMERIFPGTTPDTLGTREEARLYADLVARMQSDSLPSAGRTAPAVDLVRMRMEWANERFEDDAYVPYRHLLGQARNVVERLEGVSFRSSIVHGDLQAKNVLLGPGGRYMTIDPFLARGDIHCEVALWAVIQGHGIALCRTLEYLCDSLLLDQERLRSWAFVLAVAELRLYLPSVASRSMDYIEDFTGMKLPRPTGEVAVPWA